MATKMTRGRRRNWAEPEPTQTAGALVDEILRKRGARTEMRENTLVREWRTLVGARVAERSWPVPEAGLRDGVLTVRVANSAWLHELSFMKVELINRLNAAREGSQPILELRLQLGGCRPATQTRNTGAAIGRLKHESRPLPPPAKDAELQRIVNEASCVADPELRRIIIEVRRRLNR